MTPGAPPSLTCQQVIEVLMDYLDATLSPEMLAAFERHLAGCRPCVAYLATYRKTRDVAGAAERVEMPEEMKARLRTFLLKHLR